MARMTLMNSAERYVTSILESITQWTLVQFGRENVDWTKVQ
jgi:hypothetical protein